MAGVVTLPPHHITARAIEWLARAETVYDTKKLYKEPVGLAACGKFYHPAPFGHHQDPLISEWNCTTEDLRAIWLSAYDETFVEYTVVYKGPSSYQLGKPAVVPTCTECRLILAETSSTAPMKYGQVLKYYLQGQLTPSGFRPPIAGFHWVQLKELFLPCGVCSGNGVVKLEMMPSQRKVLYGAQFHPESSPFPEHLHTDSLICPRCHGLKTTVIQHEPLTKLEKLWLQKEEALRIMDNRANYYAMEYNRELDRVQSSHIFLSQGPRTKFIR